CCFINGLPERGAFRPVPPGLAGAGRLFGGLFGGAGLPPAGLAAGPEGLEFPPPDGGAAGLGLPPAPGFMFGGRPIPGGIPPPDGGGAGGGRLGAADGARGPRYGKRGPPPNIPPTGFGIGVEVVLPRRLSPPCLRRSRFRWMMMLSTGRSA